MGAPIPLCAVVPPRALVCLGLASTLRQNCPFRSCATGTFGRPQALCRPNGRDESRPYGVLRGCFGSGQPVGGVGGVGCWAYSLGSGCTEVSCPFLCFLGALHPPDNGVNNASQRSAPASRAAAFEISVSTTPTTLPAVLVSTTLATPCCGRYGRPPRFWGQRTPHPRILCRKCERAVNRIWGVRGPSWTGGYPIDLG